MRCVVADASRRGTTAPHRAAAENAFGRSAVKIDIFDILGRIFMLLGSSASLVSSIEVGPGIDISSGGVAHGVLPLVAERTPSLELPVWACGVSRWTPSLEGLAIPSIY